jgi:hypothetical protein
MDQDQRMGIRRNPEGTGWWAYERDLGRVALFIDDVDDLVQTLEDDAASVTIKAEGVVIDSASDLAGASLAHLRTLQISTRDPSVDVFLQPNHAAVRTSERTADAKLLAVKATDFFDGHATSSGQRLLGAIRRSIGITVAIFVVSAVFNIWVRSLSSDDLGPASIAWVLVGTLMFSVVMPVFINRVIYEGNGVVVLRQTRAESNASQRRNRWTVAGWHATNILAGVAGYAVAVLTR